MNREIGEQMETKEALRSVLAGNKDDFRFIIREYVGVVRSFLASRLFDGTMVDDLAQEVFIAVFEQLKNYKTDLSFKSWLLGIANNKLKMHYRSMSNQKTAYEKFLETISPSIEAVELESESNEKVGKLNRCLEDLSARMKTFLNLKYFEKMRVCDIALEHGLEEDAVSALLYRSRKKLADCMGYIK